MEIAVRAYDDLKKNKEPEEQDTYEPKKHSSPDYNRIFVFDTETTSDQYQNLLFGSFVLKRGNMIEHIGLFYNPELVDKEGLKALQEYCKRDITIKLYTREDFVEQVFYHYVHKQEVPCVCFNAPFDISRLAIKSEPAKSKRMKHGFTLTLSKEAKYPPITIKHLNIMQHSINFQTVKYSKFRGYFLDCQVIAGIMMDKKHVTLKESCARYNKIYQKIDVEEYEHGTITEKYIAYNITDTLSTAELFINLKKEYERFEVDKPLHQIFSSASIGKAALEKLGIKPFMELNPRFASDLYGKIAQAYYGGRCECRIRATPCKVTVLDFTSMYPSLFILLDGYSILTCNRLDVIDETENVKQFVENINNIDDLKDPQVWKRMNVIVEVQPEDDLLPVRANYDGDNFTVGVNYLTSKQPLYYGLPSIIASKLMTGKIPKINKAFRFVPIGKQRTLKKARISGIEIDPISENIFKYLVEQRQISKLFKDGRDRMIKILVNATSYGIYIELNRQDEESKVIVYSGNEKFEDFKRFEEKGKYFNPIISTIITDAAKLLLTICECILKKHDEVIAYCDTDSVYVPPYLADEVVKFFDALNPYSNVKNLLKIEEENIWFYGISAKRYCLYQIDEKGNFIIKDSDGEENYSLHGLGHLINPFGKQEGHWQKQIWLDILAFYYGKLNQEEFHNKYKSYFAISKFTVSTSNLMNRFSKLNKKKNYKDKIKPFNFFLRGFSNMKNVKPIGPYSKDPQTMPYSKFINYENGKIMQGIQYFKSLADELLDYAEHPESKLDGKEGILQKRHINAERIIFIGKEADKIDLRDLEKPDYNIYNNPKDLEEFFSHTWGEIKHTRIPESRFYALKKRYKEGKLGKMQLKTLKKISKLYAKGDLNDKTTNTTGK